MTHHDERCRTAVLAITMAAAALVRGEPPDSALTAAVETALPREGGEELEFLVGAVGRARRIDGPDRTFCLFAAAAGLQALTRAGDAMAALMATADLGGDVGANAAVAGSLLGAAGGARGLPPAVRLAGLRRRWNAQAGRPGSGATGTAPRGAMTGPGPRWEPRDPPHSPSEGPTLLFEPSERI